MSNGKSGAAPLTVLVLTAAFALAGPLIAFAPLGMWVLLVATALAAMVAEQIQARRWPNPSPLSVTLSVLFVGWCALSIAWDLNPADGSKTLRDLVAIFGSAVELLGLAGRFSDAQRRRLAQAVIGGTIVGLVLLGIETGFDYPLHRWLMGPNPKYFALLESKRSVDALPLLVWPAALCLERLGRPWLGLGLAVIWTAASFRLTAASATLGMVLSLAVFGLAYWSAPIARKALTAATLLAFVLIIPVADTAYSLGPTPETCRFKFSACHRFEIWHFAAEKSLDRPLFGHGLNSSRFVPNDGAVSAFQPDPTKPMIPLHPHDAFLQIWLELGAVGVVLAGALLLSVLRVVKAWPAQAAGFGLAGYAAAMTVAGLAFGIWQTWWMATLAFGAVTSACVVRRVNNG